MSSALAGVGRTPSLCLSQPLVAGHCGTTQTTLVMSQTTPTQNAIVNPSPNYTPLISEEPLFFIAHLQRMFDEV